MKQKHYVLFIIEKLVYIDGFTNLELFLLFFLCDCILAKKINGYSGNLIFKQESILRRSKQAANLLQKNQNWWKKIYDTIWWADYCFKDRIPVHSIMCFQRFCRNFKSMKNISGTNRVSILKAKSSYWDLRIRFAKLHHCLAMCAKLHTYTTTRPILNRMMVECILHS